ncbi:hypothetical protein BATDEDRAFT_18937 [Batrachochytrium dendrobatidis JAM81]|uniref:Deacetylase sirtuin-type domain-containing protein n=1 Tax=Batrachochytrium dendrobatidis (strain JAM81 / FGSC 10211) TaxID=684364 RepID=F4NYJ7_BATDJ|nr:uncharacterized protein BATDEDRAFT_18937 [Batrachochytrium dendrobatidis JAM81]EGF81724.1 hypothetical protein BATDEDRAFT_18937 [Batrachochytrium dendrobatidis JAM81]|eukprot:XP_006677190.1 hypothetical protein BATDEDRAFT_18937 [Batrachochytrium dendrobatidis JAM81]
MSSSDFLDANDAFENDEQIQTVPLSTHCPLVAQVVPDGSANLLSSPKPNLPESIPTTPETDKSAYHQTSNFTPPTTKKSRPPPTERKTLTPLEEKIANPKLCILKDSSIESFVEYLKENECSKVIVMTGAGISTSAGIPDFRTPNTGLYDNLASYKLPYPEAIFDIAYFRQKPQAFYTLARELFPGNYNPTPTHHFIKKLADNCMLLRNYTQNIDMLERMVGVDDDFLVEAHGSFHLARCVDIDACGKTYTIQEFKSALINTPIPRCECGGLIKPDIVFFGESLPRRFYDLLVDDFQRCDALIVMGTSLQVQPFAGLVNQVGPLVPRLLVNKDMCGDSRQKTRGFDFVGDVQKIRRDAIFLGSCDNGAQLLTKLLGFNLDDTNQADEKSIDALADALVSATI